MMLHFAAIGDPEFECAIERSELETWIRQFRWERADGRREWDPEWVAYYDSGEEIFASSREAYMVFCLRNGLVPGTLKQISFFEFPWFLGPYPAQRREAA